MKLPIAVLLMAFLAASVQAVTFAWKAPGNWKNETDWVQEVSNVWLYQSQDANMTAAQVFEKKSDTSNIRNVTNALPADKTKTEFLFTVEGTYNFETDSTTEWVNKNSYVYVVFEKAAASGTGPEYIVAHSSQYTGDTATDKGRGFYTPAFGTEPEAIEYADLQSIGGTWTKAAPEPTALAILALGIAGLALRRRA